MAGNTGEFKRLAPGRLPARTQGNGPAKSVGSLQVSTFEKLDAMKVLGDKVSAVDEIDAAKDSNCTYPVILSAAKDPSPAQGRVAQKFRFAREYCISWSRI